MGIKNKFLFLIGILILSGFINFCNLNHEHGWGGDFSLYIQQAKSIIEGNVNECLADITFTVDNSAPTIMPIPGLFFWGFPVLLSPVYYFFGLNLFAMKVFLLFFFFLSLITIYRLFRSKLDNISLLLIVSIFAFNPYLIEFNNNILSDIPYLFFSLFSILLIDRFVLGKKFWFNKSVSLLLIGLFIFYASYIRPNGIVLIPTLFICQIIKNGKLMRQNFKIFISKNKADFIPYLVFLFLFVSTKKLLPAAPAPWFRYILSYLTPVNILRHVIDYIDLPAEFFNPHLSRIIYGFTLPFVLFGISKRGRKDYLFIIYSVFTLGVFIICPATQGLRYIFSILPFYMYFAFIGLLNTPFEFPQIKYFNRRLKLVHAFSILLIFYFVLQSSYSAYLEFTNRKEIDGPFTVESTEMFNFVSKNIKKDDVIIFCKPRVLYLLTAHRKSITITNPSQVYKGDYIVIHKHRDSSAIIEQLQNQQNIFRPIFENRNFVIYHIAKA